VEADLRRGRSAPLKPRSLGFEDRGLHLIQAVLHLGIHGADVRWHSLRRNAHVRSSDDISDLVKHLHALTSPYAEERNSVVHQRGHLDERLRRIELWHLASGVQGDRRGQFQSLYMRDIRAFVTDKIGEMEDFTESAGKLTARMFDILSPIFDRTLQQL
jgi:hypothetical protein